VQWQELLGPSHIRRFGLEKDGYILFVGRLIPTKGAELLIDAYNKIRPKVKLVIVGASSHTNGYEKKLRSKAGGNVRFLGYQYGEHLRALYSNCKLFVFPSLIEGLPMVLLEAFSFLRPTIYSDIPENAEIADGSGIAFRSGDAADLAEKLNCALSNGSELDACDVRIREKLHSEYNWERIVDKYIEVYQTAVNRHRFDSSKAESAL
jgi:glycosyltransferase involved in cell wall biosynthesis